MHTKYNTQLNVNNQLNVSGLPPQSFGSVSVHLPNKYQQLNVFVSKELGCSTVKSRSKMMSFAIEHVPSDDYDPLQIPADWEAAKKHGQARNVSIPKDNGSSKIERCSCCGFEIDRELLELTGGIDQLSFLGPGFPLFYNFLYYCVFLLFVFFFTRGIFSMLTNLMGNYCDKEKCFNSIIMKLSMANKIDRLEMMAIEANLNLLTLISVCVVLFFFRRSQCLMNIEIDEDFITPSDYAIMVKNVPKGLDVNYQYELTKIFNREAVPDTHIVVTNVDLVYDATELFEEEEKMGELVKEKQQILLKNGLDFGSEEVKKANWIIEEKVKEIEILRNEIQKNGKEFFAGIAFISFETVQMKTLVLQRNTHTLLDQLLTFFNEQSTNDTKLKWSNHRLFLEQAPEPNDVNWEFIHRSTMHKLKMRTISLTLFIGLLFLCFIPIFLLSFSVNKLNEKVIEGFQEQSISYWLQFKTNLIVSISAWSIVIFNKFIMAYVIHHIVDMECISTQSKFNIQFATKLTIALFLNTAVITYISDIVIIGNVIQPGGFIQNETFVFILNALFPPFVWLVDPYSLLQKFRQIKEQEQHSVLTQQQANAVMEHTEYYQAKRYADVLKTMWFTFFFGNVIPLGILFSIVGLVLYYWVDKYNLMRRRTVKSVISMEVSIEMIELLEMTVILGGIGNLSISHFFFHSYAWQDQVVVVVGILYAVLPMQILNEKVFNYAKIQETETYQQAKDNFVTNYDRENPITGKEATEKWRYQQKILPVF